MRLLHHTGLIPRIPQAESFPGMGQEHHLEECRRRVSRRKCIFTVNKHYRFA